MMPLNSHILEFNRQDKYFNLIKMETKMTSEVRQCSVFSCMGQTISKKSLASEITQLAPFVLLQK